MRDCRFFGLLVRRQKATPLTLTFSLGKREVGALTEQERTRDNIEIFEITNDAPSNIHEKNRRSKKILKTHSTKFRRLKALLVNGIRRVRINLFFFEDKDAQSKE